MFKLWQNKQFSDNKKPYILQSLAT